MPKKASTKEEAAQVAKDEFPIHKAAFQGDIQTIEQIVREQLRQKKKINLVNTMNNTPLHAAARTGQTETAA